VVDVYFAILPYKGIGYAMLTAPNISSVMAYIEKYAQEKKVSLKKKK
jgi:hypothetical protein